MTKHYTSLLILLSLAATPCVAQDFSSSLSSSMYSLNEQIDKAIAAPLPQAPQPQKPLPQAPTPEPSKTPTIDPSDFYFRDGGLICSVGASTSSALTKAGGGCGLGLALGPIFLEGGAMSLQKNHDHHSGYISVDGNVPVSRHRGDYQFGALLGYSRFFGTGNSLDYGLILFTPFPTRPKNTTAHLKIELRDYYTFANPSQHNVMLRIGWMGEIRIDD